MLLYPDRANSTLACQPQTTRSPPAKPPSLPLPLLPASAADTTTSATGVLMPGSRSREDGTSACRPAASSFRHSALGAGDPGATSAPASASASASGVPGPSCWSRASDPCGPWCCGSCCCCCGNGCGDCDGPVVPCRPCCSGSCCNGDGDAISSAAACCQRCAGRSRYCRMQPSRPPLVMRPPAMTS